ncbi:MAG: hypothetical protein N2C14_21510, partial [Planctomycetales bacterium]
MALIRAAKDLFHKLDAGASGLVVARRMKQAKRLIAGLELGEEQRSQLDKRLEAVLAAAAARHSLENAHFNDEAKMNWPSGVVPVVYDPSLPRGETHLLNDYAIVGGTGGQGIMRCEMNTAARVLGVPVAEGEPVPEWRDEADPLNGVVIVNPTYTRTAINFLANNKAHRAEPGQNERLAEARSYLVEFDRGGRYGRARYDLTRGVYIFIPSARGWDL